MEKHPNIQLITAAVLALGGLILLFCGAFIAPEGQIHESLLIGFGEVATFAGALFGIDYTYKHKYHDHPTNPPTNHKSQITNHKSSRSRDAFLALPPREDA